MTIASLPLRWVTKDAWLIIWARAFRTAAHQIIAVLMAIYLTLVGLSVVEIGLLLTVGMAGGAFFAFIVMFIGDTFGRRRLLVVFTMMTAGAALALGLTDRYVVLAVGAFLGSLAVGGGPPGGPLQPLEQASLPQTAPSQRRTDLFAVYGIVGTSAQAFGALAASIPVLFRSTFGLDEPASFRAAFVVAAGMIAFGALLYAFLSRAIEVPIQQQRWTNPVKTESRRTIFRLVGVFSLDHFGTGLVLHTFVALWFSEKFGLDIKEIAGIFFLSQLMSAASQWTASKLANRFGLINTIVFTHIPPTAMLMAMPFVPWAWLAATLWLLRGFFNLMDVPTKQSYTMAVVQPHERSAMAATNNLARSIIGSISPSVAGVLWNSFSAAMPFLAGGLFKSIYLIGLYWQFKDVHPEEERARIAARSPVATAAAPAAESAPRS